MPGEKPILSVVDIPVIYNKMTIININMFLFIALANILEMGNIQDEEMQKW